MREEVRIAIGNAVESIESAGRKALHANDYESAGIAFTAVEWLRYLLAQHQRSVAPPAEPEKKPKKEKAAASEGGEPPKKRGRKPKAQQDLLAAKTRDTDPPPAIQGEPELNGGRFGELDLGAERD
ncbi:MAG TPA: hypothetical protein VGY54_03990 [Polyangiaceae bacterium]|jgi:hypothetical protein|nr:hypothetical protein [Polyangiaceae bacterium]